MVSENIKNDNLAKLRVIFPQFVKEDVIDFDALREFFNKEGILAGTEKYGLNWAGKSNAFRALRKPSSGTLTPDLESSKNFESTENIFIEGDNLEVLKLLQKHYANPGKIKMIYIDPPYNTGKDFIYPDNFTEGVSDYYKKTRQTKDGIKMTSNPESNGRFHSDWLTMMYPRLSLARNILKDDGVIFVSIDDNEVANLRLIMDEIFGEENFIQSFMWLHGKGKKDKNSRTLQQYILCFAKNKELLSDWSILEGKNYKFENPDNDLEGPWFSGSVSFSEDRSNKKHKNYFPLTSPSGIIWERQWQYTNEEMMSFINRNRIYWGTAPNFSNVPRLKIRPTDTEEIIPENIIGDVGTTKSAETELASLIGENIFNYPKPVGLLSHISALSTRKLEQDIILDFFAGSGTTAHAVMDLNAEDGGNRKWICVQIPEEIDEKSEAFKAGYKTIAEISRKRIHHAGEKIEKGDIGFKSYKLLDSNYRAWNTLTSKDSVDDLLKQSKLFVEKPLIDNFDEQAVVYEILVKEGFSLNAKVFPPTDNGLPLWVVVEDGKRGKLAITFAKKVNQEDLTKTGVSVVEEDIFVCFDSALDDTTKVNIMRNLIMKTI